VVICAAAFILPETSITKQYAPLPTVMDVSSPVCGGVIFTIE